MFQQASDLAAELDANKARPAIILDNYPLTRDQLKDFNDQVCKNKTDCFFNSNKNASTKNGIWFHYTNIKLECKRNKQCKILVLCNSV